MPIFEIERGGQVFEVDAPDQATALDAAGMQPSPSHAPQSGMSDEAWAAMSTPDKVRSGLQWAGKAVSSMTGMGEAGGDAVDNPKTFFATSLAPAIAGKGLKALGHGMYRSALKPSAAIRREFSEMGKPNSGGRVVTDALMDAGVPITRSGAGTQRATEVLRTLGQASDDMLTQADAAGVKPVTLRPVLRSLSRTREKIGNRLVRGDAGTAVDDFRAAALAENPARMPLTRANTVKQAEQGLALDAYLAKAKGQLINSIETGLHEDAARGLREAIERRVPAVGPANAETRRMIGGVRAISDAENRIANNNLVGMGDLLSVGSGAAGAAAMGPEGALLGVLQSALTRPEIASRLGIAANRAGGAVTPQNAAAMRQALMALMSSHGGK